MAAPARLGAAGLHRPGPQAPLSLRTRVFRRRATLDCLLAAGADPSWDPELALRAAQISALRRRHTLGDSLERAVWEAHRPPRWDCRAPLNRRAVRSATPELSALALDLRLDAAPAAQGVALATQLLRNPSSPLYAHGGGEALRAAAVIAHQALSQSAAVVQD